MNGNDTFLDINNAHLRVNSGNVQASTFVLDQINIVTSANTTSTVNFNNVTKAFNAVSSIEVGTANLFVDTTTSNVGIGTDAPAYTLDVHGTANVGNLYTTSNVGINTNSPQQTLHINGGTLIGGHVLPTQHEQFDIGSADAKIRHMFLSDNSLWIGDEAKLSFTGNQLKFRRRKKNAVPRGLVAIGAAQDPELNESTLQTNALAHANKSSVGDMKLEHWLAYAKTLDATKELSDVFTNQDADYDVTSASEAFKEIGNEIYSTHKLRLGSSVAPTATLDITGTAKVSGDVTVDTDTFHIDTTNNKVGIGETSPAELVHIRGSKPQLLIEGESNENANIDFSSGPAYRNRRHQIQTEHYALSGHATSNKMHFRVNGGGENTPSIRMTVRGDGNVGVCTSSPLARLSVATSGSVSRGAEWSSTDFVVSGFNGSTAGRSLGVAIGTNHGEDANGNGSIWCLRPALTWNDLYFQCRNFYILNAGGYSYTETSTQITSDDRLKSEEEYLENALSTIMKLKPQKYRKAPFLPNDPLKEMTENMTEMPKDLSKIEAGLIVQDIWYDAPELRYLISLGKDANPSDTKPTDPDPSDPAQDPDYSSWGTTKSHLDYGGINIYLIKAVQELSLKNDALEARIAALENAS